MQYVWWYTCYTRATSSPWTVKHSYIVVMGDSPDKKTIQFISFSTLIRFGTANELTFK